MVGASGLSSGGRHKGSLCCRRDLPRDPTPSVSDAFQPGGGIISQAILVDAVGLIDLFLIGLNVFLIRNERSEQSYLFTPLEVEEHEGMRERERI